MIDSKLCTSYNNYLWKLGEHPATPQMIFPLSYMIDFSLQQVCKNGKSKHTKKDGVSVWYNKENYKRFKKRFDRDFKEYDDKPEFTKIEVPYIEYFGYPWKFDHCEYWGESTIKIFTGNDFKDQFNQSLWEAHQAFNVSATSYEEMIIKICKLHLKYFGRKQSEDYLTPEEKQNHIDQPVMFTSRKSEDGRFSYLDLNPKFIRVTDAEINRRWLREFVKTDYCKKNYDFSDILKDDKNG